MHWFKGKNDVRLQRVYSVNGNLILHPSKHGGALVEYSVTIEIDISLGPRAAQLSDDLKDEVAEKILQDASDRIVRRAGLVGIVKLSST